MPDKYLDINGVKKIRDLVAQDINNHHDETKQDTIVDLSEIRSGAIAGATAVQPGEIGTISTEDVRHLFDIVTKGSIVKFDALGDGSLKRFRVLKCNGDVAMLMSMDNDITSSFNITTSSQVYATSALDAVCDTYYNNLSNQVKSAILATDRSQSIGQNGTAKSDNAQFNVSLDRATAGYAYYSYFFNSYASPFTRQCFSLDLQDIKEYFNVEQGNVINYTDLLILFFEQKPSSNKMVWLSTAYSNNSNYAYQMFSYYGAPDKTVMTSTGIVRPCFNINLSQIDFIVEE